MAQLVARLVRNEKVRGSNPLSSTIRLLHEPVSKKLFWFAPSACAGGVFVCLLVAVRAAWVSSELVSWSNGGAGCGVADRWGSGVKGQNVLV